MVYYKITLARSVIGLPQATRDIVKTLGLGKRGSVIYRQVTPAIAGSMIKVKEIIDVEVTKDSLNKFEQRQLRKSNPGFVVEKRSDLLG
ncbi:hypothetical protein NCAS_0B00260 [Naumovozyma castellii]|uniref:Large ribosomal subunit protein uL30m n=1 Tax=Naumovozyma castellii TaxID=27288 RepID=G0VAY7_NAUCA|nr:hypothetical protein NCAS_0B00260 [Naumovozyma castellii CBS 4309]CCC68110.1 hypothetical protein NCAS_0B00260 [Naumovozyma castellii CBS 4309]